MTADPGLLGRSRDPLEQRISPHFVEIGSTGALDRNGLIAAILGTDPGTWEAEFHQITRVD